MRGFWKCQRQSGGVKCGASNPNRVRKCTKCSKSRPARKKPAHMSALDLPYEYYAEINGGAHCGICGRLPSATKRLDRDHEHKGVGFPRGLLCWNCNRQLKHTSSVAWLRAAADYLERAEARR
jgi:recombination endonuclease VII